MDREYMSRANCFRFVSNADTPRHVAEKLNTAQHARA